MTIRAIFVVPSSDRRFCVVEAELDKMPDYMSVVEEKQLGDYYTDSFSARFFARGKARNPRMPVIDWSWAKYSEMMDENNEEMDIELMRVADVELDLYLGRYKPPPKRR